MILGGYNSIQIWYQSHSWKPRVEYPVSTYGLLWVRYFAYGLLSHVTNHRYNLGNAKWILVRAVNFKAPSHVGCIRMSSVIYKHWTFPVQGLVPKGLGQNKSVAQQIMLQWLTKQMMWQWACTGHKFLLTPFWHPFILGPVLLTYISFNFVTHQILYVCQVNKNSH